MEKVEHKPGTGLVWLNKDVSMPAFRVSFKIHRAILDGETLEIAMWNNETKSGQKYYGLTVQDVWVKPDQPKENVEVVQGNRQDLDDEIPF